MNKERQETPSSTILSRNDILFLLKKVDEEIARRERIEGQPYTEKEAAAATIVVPGTVIDYGRDKVMNHIDYFNIR